MIINMGDAFVCAMHLDIQARLEHLILAAGDANEEKKVK